MGKIDFTKYPRNWKRVSQIIRSLAGGRCEWCGNPCDSLEVHHIGTPWADGRPGNHCDKHDLRRENLAAICFTCHNQAEHVGAIRRKKRDQKKRRRARLEAHQALGIGTGLMPLGNTPTRPSTIVPFMVILRAVRFHMEVQRTQARERRTVDSTLIYVG